MTPYFTTLESEKTPIFTDVGSGTSVPFSAGPGLVHLILTTGSTASPLVHVKPPRFDPEPVGTNAVVFYGQSTGTTSTSTVVASTSMARLSSQPIVQQQIAVFGLGSVGASVLQLFGQSNIAALVDRKPEESYPPPRTEIAQMILNFRNEAEAMGTKFKDIDEILADIEGARKRT